MLCPLLSSLPAPQAHGTNTLWDDKLLTCCNHPLPSLRVAAVVSQEDADLVEEHMEDVGEDGPG